MPCQQGNDKFFTFRIGRFSDQRSFESEAQFHLRVRRLCGEQHINASGNTCDVGKSKVINGDLPKATDKSDNNIQLTPLKPICLVFLFWNTYVGFHVGG